MDKVVYIIPGFGESNKQRAYKQIASYFKSKGIKPISVDNIKWKYNTMSDYVTQLMKRYKPNGETYILGFSYGAMLAFIASVKIKPKMQILCSLSPYFKEDLSHIPNTWKLYAGIKRINDHKNCSFNQLAKKTECKTTLLVGSKELKPVLRRANEAHKKLKNSKLIIIEGAKHKIAQKEYQKALKKIISNLN